MVSFGLPRLLQLRLLQQVKTPGPRLFVHYLWEVHDEEPEGIQLINFFKADVFKVQQKSW